MQPPPSWAGPTPAPAFEARRPAGTMLTRSVGGTEGGKTRQVAMSLSEKLEQARRQRMIAAGLLEKRTGPAPEPGGDPDGAEPSTSELPAEPVRIDVAPTSLATVVETEAAGPAAHEGVSCPNCNREGRVDMVDLVGQRTHMSCARCGAMWQVHSTAGVTRSA